jgi:hypothetical protein
VIYTTESKVRYEAARAEQFDIQLSAELLEKVVVEHERLQFKQLLAMNPNYFGNLGEQAAAGDFSIVFPLSNKTKYEQLNCVGLYPADNLLEAMIEV